MRLLYCEIIKLKTESDELPYTEHKPYKQKNYFFTGYYKLPSPKIILDILTVWFFEIRHRQKREMERNEKIFNTVALFLKGGVH